MAMAALPVSLTRTADQQCAREDQIQRVWKKLEFSWKNGRFSGKKTSNR